MAIILLLSFPFKSQKNELPKIYNFITLLWTEICIFIAVEYTKR